MSSRKGNIRQFNTIQAQSMTGNLTSLVTNIEWLDDIGIQFSWSGSPTGTFSVQVSADYSADTQGNVTNAGNWISLVLTYWNGSSFVTSTTVPTSLGSAIYLDLALLSAPYIRSIYTAGSGTGTLTTTITAKEI